LARLVKSQYISPMTVIDLDDILVQTDCPSCGAVINVPYKQLRLYKAAACSCGNLLRLTDETPVAAVQALDDEANPIAADAD
jgi:uncharacterized paraquat-inducible protein A